MAVGHMALHQVQRTQCVTYVGRSGLQPAAWSLNVFEHAARSPTAATNAQHVIYLRLVRGDRNGVRAEETSGRQESIHSLRAAQKREKWKTHAKTARLCTVGYSWDAPDQTFPDVVRAQR